MISRQLFLNLFGWAGITISLQPVLVGQECRVEFATVSASIDLRHEHCPTEKKMHSRLQELRGKATLRMKGDSVAVFRLSTAPNTPMVGSTYSEVLGQMDRRCRPMVLGFEASAEVWATSGFRLIRSRSREGKVVSEMEFADSSVEALLLGLNVQPWFFATSGTWYLLGSSNTNVVGLRRVVYCLHKEAVDRRQAERLAKALAPQLALWADEVVFSDTMRIDYDPLIPFLFPFSEEACLAASRTVWRCDFRTGVCREH